MEIGSMPLGKKDPLRYHSSASSEKSRLKKELRRKSTVWNSPKQGRSSSTPKHLHLTELLLPETAQGGDEKNVDLQQHKGQEEGKKTRRKSLYSSLLSKISSLSSVMARDGGATRLEPKRSLLSTTLKGGRSLSLSFLSVVTRKASSFASLLMRTGTWNVHPPLLSLFRTIKPNGLANSSMSFRSKEKGECSEEMVWSISIQDVILFNNSSITPDEHLQFVLRRENMTLESSLVQLSSCSVLAETNERVLGWSETLEMQASDAKEDLLLELRTCSVDIENGEKEQMECVPVGRVDLWGQVEQGSGERFAALVADTSADPNGGHVKVNVGQWYNLPSVVTWYHRTRTLDLRSEQKWCKITSIEQRVSGGILRTTSNRSAGRAASCDAQEQAIGAVRIQVKQEQPCRSYLRLHIDRGINFDRWASRGGRHVLQVSFNRTNMQTKARKREAKGEDWVFSSDLVWDLQTANILQQQRLLFRVWCSKEDFSFPEITRTPSAASGISRTQSGGLSSMFARTRSSKSQAPSRTSSSGRRGEGGEDQLVLAGELSLSSLSLQSEQQAASSKSLFRLRLLPCQAPQSSPPPPLPELAVSVSWHVEGEWNATLTIRILEGRIAKGVVKKLVEESGGRGGRAGGIQVAELLPLDLYDEDGFPGLAMFCRVRQGSGKVLGETSCLHNRQVCHWDEQISTPAPASSLHETCVQVDYYNVFNDVETLLGTATVSLKKLALNARQPSHWEDVIQQGNQESRAMMRWFESSPQGGHTVVGQLLVQTRWEMKDDDEEECQRLIDEIKKRCDGDAYLRNILFGIVQKWKFRSLQISFRALLHHMMSERLKADMAVAKWEALGVSKFMWEWQHVIEKKHKAERDVGEMLRRRYHRPAFEMFGRHVENMARLKESSGMKDVGYRTLFKFLARVGLPRLYDKMKKEKIQLKTLRNCRQNKSLEDMLVNSLISHFFSHTTQQTRRLGIDAQSIRTISDALRTQKDIESKVCTKCQRSDCPSGERDDKLEKLRERVNREQTRQVFESWLDAVMEQDSFRMKQ